MNIQKCPGCGLEVGDHYSIMSDGRLSGYEKGHVFKEGIVETILGRPHGSTVIFKGDPSMFICMCPSAYTYDFKVKKPAKQLELFGDLP